MTRLSPFPKTRPQQLFVQAAIPSSLAAAGRACVKFTSSCVAIWKRHSPSAHATHGSVEWSPASDQHRVRGVAETTLRVSL